MKGEQVCKYFLRGQCRHGLTGKNKSGDIPVCPWKHPQVCRNLLDNGHGPRGCKDENSCGKTHPKMCKFSLKNGICPKVRPRTRCPLGYHVRGTTQGESDLGDERGDKNGESGENSRKESYRDKAAKNILQGPGFNKDQKAFLMECLMKIMAM